MLSTNCLKKNSGLFLNNLQAKKIEVNCIKPLKEGDEIMITGGNIDKFISVNFTFGSNTLGSDGHFFVSDRNYKVISVKEIHMIESTDGTISVVKRNNLGDTLIINDLSVSGSSDIVQTATIIETNSLIAKEDVLIVKLNDDTDFLTGCLLSLILKVL